MPQPNDLSRSLVALDHNSTIIGRRAEPVELAGCRMLPGIERQPRKKLEPSPERLLAWCLVASALGTTPREK